MERDEAVRFLTQDCVFDPALTDADAERLWREFRDRAAALPERQAVTPPRLQLTQEERNHANRFLNFVRALGADIREVIKVDPFQLVARQYYVVTERSEGYRLKCRDQRKWMEECLPTSLTNQQLRISFAQNGLDTAADIDLPHGEFFLGINPQQGTFQATQALRHVTATQVGRRLLLWAGYHRSLAHMLSMTPTATERSALLALTSNTLVPPPTQAAGVTVVGADAGLTLFGTPPALLADFFTDGLFMRVNLRKKRYQLQVRSKWVAIDDP
jgi:hypothetical protein